ncbi:hypothetical protein SAMN04487895_10371 [Paenibacillus sophorae]|uniref:Uncharacterized protein n=1 Tax=Paenibacillus sophorae TaxID=1333845 RepID=A0A1H8JLC6_9BACL|nr:hypothetical protein [Paenibacillus sophorae]QWU13405.1 hypothetical protein KP014_15500 [Paenibacillus sophorae]SEN81573.1 hypothetical protein SAMN04487895_10371 [Paenibacillus sophorae]
MAKKLTSSILNKINSKYEERKKIYILNGEYEVQIHKYFKDALIDKVAIQYIKFLQELKTKKNIDDEIIKDTIVLLDTLILREFTDLPIPKKNNVSSLIKVTHDLLNSGVYVEVMNQISDTEIKQVHQKLEAYSEQIGQSFGEIAVRSAIEKSKEESAMA